jgi:beta-glucanase (GH16 family)
MILAAAGASRLTAQSLQPVLSPAIASQYTLFWNDEFDGSQFDPTKWDYRALGPRGAGVDSAAMVAMDGAGHLDLSVQQSGSTIYSAMIGTQGKFQTIYGYFECRAMLQTSSGPTSAFWLQSPTTGNPIGNPALAGDEVDIFECYTPQTGKIPQTIHWDGYGAYHQFLQQMSPTIPNLTQGYHTFGLEWNPAEYIFYIDGVETFRTSQAVSHTYEYIILSYLVDSAGQAAIINNTPGFSATIVYDYVRVFKNTSAVPPVAGTPLSSVNGTVGQDVTWTAVAAGTAPFAYQWRKNGVEIAGATGSTLTLTNIQAADAGDYDVVIMNVAGTTTSNGATLGVSAPVAPYNAVITITVS